MKMFKNIKRKVGNAILPVVGTILGLTILAGSVVAVALNSSKIVYRESRLEQQNDARQILYIAAKYFCTEINNGKSASQIREELQEIFGPGLKITRDTADEEKYYIWYPNRFVNANQKEFDPNQGNEQVAEWLKATIVKSEQSDDNGDHGNTGINNTLFSQEAKLDEKFAVGNMMTVYLTDEHLLPGRKYSINEVSLVESDIDTFDEAFTYMNNTGVLEIDDIAVALYKIGIVNGNDVSYTNVKTDGSYEIVYKTGNLGGNYYWANKGTNVESWLYRQEYDINLLYNMICLQDSANKTIDVDDLKYSYDESNDSHTIYTEDGSYTLTYSSSRTFADAIADYIFWVNMPRLCMYLDDFQTVIKADVNNRAPGYPYFQNLGNLDWYEWKDEGITIRPSNNRYYTEIDYKDTDIINFFEKNSSLKSKYCDNKGKLDRNLLYNALVQSAESSVITNGTGLEEAFKKVITSKVLTKDSNSGSQNTWILKDGNKYYYWDDNKWLNQVINKAGSNNDVVRKAVEQFLLGRLNIKYITGTAERGPEKLDGGEVEEILTNGLGQFQYFNTDNNTSMVIKYHYKAKVHLHPENPSQVDEKDYFSEQTGDDFTFKNDGIYMGTEKIFSFNYKTGRETFVKTFIEAFATKCNVSVGNIYSQEEINRLTREQVMKNLVTPIRYQYLPTTKIGEIVGTSSTSSYGLREENTANKLLTYYLEHGEQALKTAIGDSDYSITITKIQYLDSPTAGYLNMRIEFSVAIEGVSQPQTRKVNFLLQYMTYSPQNTAKYNASSKTYSDVLNEGNSVADIDEDGNVKRVFSPVPIQNHQEQKLSNSDITANSTRAIISNVPYTERVNSSQVPYGDHKITIDGVDYSVTNNVNLLSDVNQNILYDGDIVDLPSDFVIKVAKDKSLFINGDLSLFDNQKVELGENALLFVNGSMQVRYRVVADMRSVTETTYIDTIIGRIPWGTKTTYYTRELNTSDINLFMNNGVDITAEKDAKIMINGNFDYRGFKGKEADSSSGFDVYNSETGRSDHVDLDRIFEQFVLNAGFTDRNGNVIGSCTQNADGTWNHNSYECRGKLEGIYIINGDMNFHAWDENNTTDNSNQTISMYRNLYSNPIINGTFYVDGVFDMKGLYTSGLYDKCRANFVFAKSISQPTIALNTVLCQGSKSQYGAWMDRTTGQYTHDQGYLFMICEEAIDFSKANFACVNLFTPFQELINAINANKQSATNFSEFIEKGAFQANFPNKSVIDEWGLPSILRSGLGQLYDPGDIGAITPEDHIYGNNV